jgi:hypothetical protein
MGYYTNFDGGFLVNKHVDSETAALLRKLSNTRRVMRDTEKLKLEGYMGDYGIDGEFFVEHNPFDEERHPDGYQGSIKNYNEPPSTQPGLWCDWTLDTDNQTIIWNEAEKFYNYVEWLVYIIDRILKPRGYLVTGSVSWVGEDFDDQGLIQVLKNRVVVTRRESELIYG